MQERVSPGELARRQQVIESQWKIEDFGRLVEIVEADLSALPAEKTPREWRRSPVDIRLRFGWADAWPGIPVLSGRISTSVAAVCQRCLEPMQLELDADLKLLLLQAGEKAADSEDYEVWEFDDDIVSPAEIVEEALIMAMPFSVLHRPSDDCGRAGENGPAEKKDTVRPFGDLRSLMAGSNESNDN